MKILQISMTDRGGGAEGSAWNLFQAYRARGHRSWLAVGHKRTDDPDVVEIPNEGSQNLWTKAIGRASRPLDRAVGRVRGAGRLRNALRCVENLARISDLLRGYEDFHFPGTWRLLSLVPELPDIIHAHNLHWNYFDMRYLVPLSRQVPVILNLRDMWLLTGHCAHPLGCERWRNGCGHCPDLTIYPPIQKDRTAFNWRCKHEVYRKGRFFITAVSKWLLDQARATMPADCEYRLVENGIDLTVFRPGSQHEARSQLGFPSDAKIVMLTHHSEFKDYATMENALRLLKKKTDSPLLFVCMGKSGDSRHIGAGRIVYLGFERNPERMAQYYRASDVFIHGAKAEAFGKTIAESMACATPVVATAVDGIPELINDGESGYLVPKGDSTGMARRIQSLLDAPESARNMGNRAAEIARRRFDLNRQVQEFLDWYEEILARTRVDEVDCQ